MLCTAGILQAHKHCTVATVHLQIFLFQKVSQIIRGYGSVLYQSLCDIGELCLLQLTGCVQITFSQDQSDDAKCQLGIAAYLIRLSCDPDDRNRHAMVAEWYIDALLCTGICIIVIYFQRFPCMGCLVADLMVITDTFFICTCDDNTAV